MDDMAKYPGLSRRGNTFQLRKRIPEDVRQLILGERAAFKRASVNPGSPLYECREYLFARGRVAKVRKEVTQSLGTSDQREAKSKYHEAAAQLETLFQRIRDVLRVPTRAAEDKDIHQIAAEYYSSEDLRSNRELSDLGLSESDREAIAENIQGDLGALGKRGDSLIDHHYVSRASQMLRDRGFNPSRSQASVLGGYIKRADMLIAERGLQRLEGNFSKLPADRSLFPDHALGTAITEPSTTLEHAFSAYRQEKVSKVRHQKTAIGYDYQWKLLKSVFGPQMAIANLDRTQARRFVEIVSDLPVNWAKSKRFRALSAEDAARKRKELNLPTISATTANGHISDLSAFLNWASREDLVPKNTAVGLLLPKGPGGSSSRLPFSVEDLNKIFAGDYASIARERGTLKAPFDKGTGMPTDARYWAPLIALFTGMRLSEICQLTAGEVQPVDGIPCISVLWDISDGDDLDNTEQQEQITRSLKTSAAQRVIPIKSELIDLGFLEFVEQRGGQSQDRLFPDLKPDKNGYVSAPVSRWFARHLKQIGIKSKSKVFHSFRHTFRVAMGNANVSRDVVVKVGGWSARDQSDRYLSDPIVRRAQTELAKVKYDGLKLDHLART